MKYLSLLVPLFLAWVICVNAEQPPDNCNPMNGEDWCMNGGRCEVEQRRATCHCAKDFKGQRCQIDSSKDKPIDKIPPNYEEVEPEEARALVYEIKCTALTAPGRNPPGCGFGYALQHFRETGDYWWVYIWVKVKCCCWPCTGNGGGPGPGPSCREVFPALGRPAATYNTWDSWMCAPPPNHP